MHVRQVVSAEGLDYTPFLQHHPVCDPDLADSGMSCDSTRLAIAGSSYGCVVEILIQHSSSHHIWE
jgi:hypothetical protein